MRWTAFNRLRSDRRKKKIIEKYRVTDDSSEDSKWAARLRYHSHFHLEPDDMSDEEFIKHKLALEFCLKERGELTYK